MKDRRNVPEFEIITNLQEDIFQLVDYLKKNECELVCRNGKFIGYSHSEAVDDLIMEHCKNDKVKITARMPVRYYDDGKKVIKVTSENIKEFDKLLKEIPEKYKSKEEQ